jgi:hypothetical protein
MPDPVAPILGDMEAFFAVALILVVVGFVVLVLSALRRAGLIGSGAGR